MNAGSDRSTIIEKAGMLKAPLFIYSFSLCLALFACSCTNRDYRVYIEKVDGLPERVDFNYHIKPILSDRCFACHGPDANARSTDFRLDTEEGAFAALVESKGARAIIAGDPHNSEIFRRIISDDPEYMMPPPESNLTLSEREVALITKWIEQGAEWKKHWSFIPLEKQNVPIVKNTEWPKNEID
ncbi:MAG TPA: c-type cytochrome domain-containing protein, partial [Chryseosolibacter sp.]|nr:c-type cytochrome domain-containing protein [Chryseosolibacter sp.]